MEKKNQIPKYPHLRFPEFTDEWKEVKLGEVLKFFSTNTLSWDQLEYAKEGIINIHYGLIHKLLPTLTDVTRACLPKVRNEMDVKNSELCQNGDVLIADASEDTDNVGKSIELIGCNNRKIVAGLHTLHGRSQDVFAIGFKGYLLASPDVKKQLQKIAQGVKVYSINPRLISPIILRYPSLPEQRKIAALLSLIDERIEVQNAIIKEQEALKASLLRRLFDRTLRFPEFTDEWKKVKLGKVAEISKGSGISKDQLSPHGLPCILYGELYTKYSSELISEIISHTELDPLTLILSNVEDVIIPSSGETAIDIAAARCIPIAGVAIGGDLNIIRSEETNGAFLAYQLNGIRKKEIAKMAQGSSVVHLYGHSLSKLTITYPTLPEQLKIAALLSAVDERLAVERAYTEQLKLQKTYLLRQMFI